MSVHLRDRRRRPVGRGRFGMVRPSAVQTLVEPKAIHMTSASQHNVAERGAQARENLVNALRECGELAEAVAAFQGQELIEVLDYLDSLRFVMAESGQLLAGVVRGEQG